MKPEEIRKLLGGYATGTLTEAEREALFAAALDDQELFNELAGEEPLRELLTDPGARAEMLAAVEPRPRVWSWWRPAVAALAVAAIGAVVVLLPKKNVPPPTIVAEVKPAAPPPLDIPSNREEKARPPKRVRKMAPVALPPAPEITPLREAPKASAPGMVGGVAGGVLGGIISSPRSVGTPAPPPPPPPNFRSSFSPSTSDTVQVTASAAAIQVAPTARERFFQAPPVALQFQAVSGAPPPQQVLGIRYSVVRDQDAGTVTLRITANINGFVSVAGAEPVALTAMRPYTTGPLEGNEARVVFARTPEKSLTAPVTVVTETVGGEVYVVTPTPAPEIGFTVPLSQR